MFGRLRKLLEGDAHNEAGGVEPEYLENARIRVVKMACGGCARNIEAKIAGMGGVCRVSTDLKAKLVEVTFDRSRTGEGEIRKVLTNQGYLIE